MSIRFALTIIFATVVATMLCATTAHARDGVANKDDCVDQMTLVDDGVPTLAEVVVPCAMVDSGALGADCHDATFYVVNQTGTLLCRLDVMVLGLSSGSSTIEDSQPASAVVHVAMAHAAIASVVDLSMLPPGMIDLPRATGAVLLGPADDHVSFSPRPS